MEKFEYKLDLLREIYNNKYIDRVEEEEDPESNKFKQNEDQLSFLTDSTDEWQTIDTFKKNQTLSPRV